MREIIQVQVGQCGNQVGCQFWEMIAAGTFFVDVEHGIGPDGSLTAEGKQGLEKVYFNQASSGVYVPRAVLVDLEPGAIDALRSVSII